MAYIYRTIIKILPVIFILGVLSCKKQVDNARTNDTTLGKLAFISENRIRINQVCTIFDSLFIKDSIDFVIPPGGRLYEWKTIPDNGCGLLSGYYKNGLPSFTFRCAGAYGITATIYDSLTKQLLGHTDTAFLTVSPDTLQPFQSIQPDDTLTISPRLIKAFRGDPPFSQGPSEIYIQLVMVTSKKYDYSIPYTELYFDSTTDPNSYSYVFNKIKLTSYPYVVGFGVKDRVFGATDLKDMKQGIPATINITWLGKTYTGSVTLVNDNQYTISWVNSGAVIFTK